MFENFLEEQVRITSGAFKGVYGVPVQFEVSSSDKKGTFNIEQSGYTVNDIYLLNKNGVMEGEVIGNIYANPETVGDVVMTNYEMIKNQDIHAMALILMCPYELGFLDKRRCDQPIAYDNNPDIRVNNCGKCVLDWLQEKSL